MPRETRPGRANRKRAKVALALAGGGPEGAVWEIGALQAMEEAVEGVDFNQFDVYVGVSAGSFIAACLVNGLTTAQLCRSTVRPTWDDNPFVRETFFRPALREFVQRGMMAPRLALEALWDFASNPADKSLIESFTRMSRALPIGIFDNEPIRRYLEKAFGIKDRTDDFRELERKLVVVAADLDSGKAVRFGEGELAHVPISRAVQASTALPGLYPPVLIDDRHYVDGVLLKTVHGSVALDAGADVVLCVNPIVPIDTTDSIAAGAMRRGKLVHRGLPTVLSQTFRTLVHSRLSVGLASYEPRYPDRDVILIEPGRDDYRMFFTNIFSFSQRKAVCEHAYRSTRRQLLERYEELAPILERHGLSLNREILEDEREVWASVGDPDGSGWMSASGELTRTLDRLEKLLQK